VRVFGKALIPQVATHSYDMTFPSLFSPAVSEAYVPKVDDIVTSSGVDFVSSIQYMSEQSMNSDIDIF
jgi:hypothetical protein